MNKKIILSTLAIILIAGAVFLFNKRQVVCDYRYEIIQKTQQNCTDSTNCTSIYLSYPVFDTPFFFGADIDPINEDVYRQIAGSLERTPQMMIDEFFASYTQDSTRRAEMFPEDKFYPAWTYSVECSVLVNAPKLIVTSLDSYQYEGGAHGIGGKSYTNYDLINGTALSIEDVFSDSVSVAKITTKFFIEQKGLDPELPFIQQGYFVEGDCLPMSHNFALLPKGVIFYYGVYQIAPYYFGATEVLVSYEALEGLIKYKPDFKNADVFEQTPANS